jgi:hypothetical protein
MSKPPKTNTAWRVKEEDGAITEIKEYLLPSPKSSNNIYEPRKMHALKKRGGL